jgi:iron(II)-dependent oxidoreductase
MWWREVILLFVGLEDDATQHLRRLRRHDLFLAAAALSDARPVQTDAFEKIAGEIITELEGMMEEDLHHRQESADALAEIARWGATEYLFQKIHTEGQSSIVLAAVLGLAQVAERELLKYLFDPLGRILRLLNGSLGRFNAEVDQRSLSLLEALGFPMVFVPAGEFLMGSDKYPDERPLHRIYLDNYWIDKYPVTNTQFQRFVSETDYKPQGPWRDEFMPGTENHPVVCVTWNDAVAFSKWAGKRLPTEVQWEKAARGTDGRIYPWGNQWDASRCNVSTRGTTPVDQFPNGVSPYGCYDMVGNVWEWCSIKQMESYKDYDKGSGECVIRGGSFFEAQKSVRCAARRMSHGAEGPFSYLRVQGFRTAVSPFDTELWDLWTLGLRT